MTDKVKPTANEMWEVLLKKCGWHYSVEREQWIDPDLVFLNELPPLTLDNLFKYPVPLALEKLSENFVPLMKLFQLWYDELVEISGDSSDTRKITIALFRVLQEVISAKE